MDGAGVFESKEHQTYSGGFKNNYFQMGGSMYINPFESKEAIRAQMEGEK